MCLMIQVGSVGERGIDADALSTIAFSLGLEKGLELIERLSDTEAVFATKEKHLVVTSGLADVFTITNNEFTLIR